MSEARGNDEEHRRKKRPRSDNGGSPEWPKSVGRGLGGSSASNLDSTMALIPATFVSIAVDRGNGQNRWARIIWRASI